MVEVNDGRRRGGASSLFVTTVGVCRLAGRSLGSVCACNTSIEHYVDDHTARMPLEANLSPPSHLIFPGTRGLLRNRCVHTHPVTHAHGAQKASCHAVRSPTSAPTSPPTRHADMATFIHTEIPATHTWPSKRITSPNVAVPRRVVCADRHAVGPAAMSSTQKINIMAGFALRVGGGRTEGAAGKEAGGGGGEERARERGRGDFSGGGFRGREGRGRAGGGGLGRMHEYMCERKEAKKRRGLEDHLLRRSISRGRPGWPLRRAPYFGRGGLAAPGAGGGARPDAW